MKRCTWGKLVGRVVLEVLLFSSLTGCAYAATEQVLPRMETPAASISSVVAEAIALDPSQAPSTAVEERRLIMPWW